MLQRVLGSSTKCWVTGAGRCRRCQRTSQGARRQAIARSVPCPTTFLFRLLRTLARRPLRRPVVASLPGQFLGALIVRGVGRTPCSGCVGRVLFAFMILDRLLFHRTLPLRKKRVRAGLVPGPTSGPSRRQPSRLVTTATENGRFGAISRA